MRKPKVYLAGPISGTNHEQRHVWREDLKARFSEEFEFIDPTDNVIEAGRSDFDVVRADAEAIRSADAMLANMWRESIGTAFGILHAHSAGKLVVVCDPNYLQSRMVCLVPISRPGQSFSFSASCIVSETRLLKLAGVSPSRLRCGQRWL